ncbi:MAG: AAA family ATPase [Candidatus Moranbacteria bacterium]|nr:AAA family ATPase [Candidatus Moranbacteria bacterium]
MIHIIGHKKERERLRWARERNCVAQSYIFFGPQGIGKSLCALEFSCALVGEPFFTPSDDQPTPLDVLVMRPREEEKRGVIKVKNIAAEDVREALRFLSCYPASGKYRVVIIEEAHKLSLSAQNVLLKTLEEPNPSAVIILVTHEKGTLGETILSRTQNMRFDFVSEEEMMATIDQNGQDIAPFFFSLGRPGMIFRALHFPQEFIREKEALTRLFKLSSLPLVERMKLAEELGKNIPQAVRLLEWWLPGLHAQALRDTDTWRTARFFVLLELTETTLRLLKTTQANGRLLLEKLFFSV